VGEKFAEAVRSAPVAEALDEVKRDADEDVAELLPAMPER
jgi:hypothetical protein